MAKTIFGTTEKSNFILNMDLDKYRAFCVKLLLGMLWANAASEAVWQMTYSIGSRMSQWVAGGGMGMLVGFLLIALRSIATIFSIGGVFALIAAVVGMMRLQYTKMTLIPYLSIAASLVIAMISMFLAFDYNSALFGWDGRDEGWFTLLMYGAMFYVGSMFRQRELRKKFLNGIIIFGIAQCFWALLQSLFGFASQYKMVDPLLYQNVYLPSGFTDSPITFAMLLAILSCISICAMYFAEEKKTRILAAICAVGSVVFAFRTQVIAGLVAGCGAILLAVILLAVKRKSQGMKALKSCALVIAGAACGFAWAFFTPALQHSYNTATDEQLANGYTLMDGGIVWDDGYYRLGACGPYSSAREHDFDIYDAVSVLKHCQSEAVRAIKKYPLSGTGPDNFGFTQLHTTMDISMEVNSIDRPYNDFLYIAATRGIFSLLLYLVTIVSSIWIAWKRRREMPGWEKLAMGAAVVLYLLASLVGVSVLTVSPVFWMLLGMLASDCAQVEVKQ
ncbi:MAG: O-antigen ligase family protein [Oscillospiraceae bacterium]|nr:O-antigen ligase family protein [Oscillospiraceae bacterium]